MAEKGGKGFSLPKGGAKSSLKSPDSPAKSKSGRKVQFDSDVSPEPRINPLSKSNGKDGNPMGKGDWGKGGKGGKKPVAKESSTLELRIEQDSPANAKCLMDCEALDILQGIQEQMVILSEDPTIKIPTSFDKGLQYAKSGNQYTSPQSVRRILEPLKKHGVSDGEMCMIANTYPESVEEVFALVPSLKSKKSKLVEPLKDALTELAALKQ